MEIKLFSFLPPTCKRCKMKTILRFLILSLMIFVINCSDDDPDGTKNNDNTPLSGTIKFNVYSNGPVKDANRGTGTIRYKFIHISL